jgi:hypothetical protein
LRHDDLEQAALDVDREREATLLAAASRRRVVSTMTVSLPSLSESRSLGEGSYPDKHPENPLSG